MPKLRLIAATSLTMAAFAGNSLLCRAALRHTDIDPASFTTIRILAGAIVLGCLSRMRGGASGIGGSWTSAASLLVYAAGFSFAYESLPAGTGALLLFGAVQSTMIGYAVLKGERLGRRRTLGLLMALSGLVGLLLPGLSAPPWLGSLLMLLAGVAWGVYSLRGKGSGNPLHTTAGNFLRAVPPTVLLSLLMHDRFSFDPYGTACAVASGAVTSGLGYALWYSVLPALRAASAATVQLSVPVITAMAGVVFLGEPITGRLLASSAAILGGIFIVLRERRG